MRKVYKQPEVGERYQNKTGDWYTVIESNGCKDIVIKFDKLGFIKKTQSIYVRSGGIWLPKYFIGDKFLDKIGNIVTLVEINTSQKYTFEWEDGYRRTCQASVLTAGTLSREEDSCRINPEIKVGQYFVNTQGIKLKVIGYDSSKRITVEVHGPKVYEIITSQCNLKKGVVHDKYSPSVAGVGIIGDANVDIKSQVYLSWTGMMKRCYGLSESKAVSKVNYIGCSVSEEFIYFSDYETWYKKQKVQPQWHLDKDLLVKGNKIYSADTCVFLPRELNTFLTLRRNHRGPYPIGVTYHERLNKYQATCNRDNKSIYLGLYSNPEDAFFVYKKEKESFAKELASRWKGQIEDSAYNALMNFEVNIED